MIRGLQARGWKDVTIVACGTLVVVLALALVALPGLCYIGWVNATQGKPHDVMAGLLELAALDASWEHAALRSMNELAPASTVDHTASLARIAKHLQDAAQETPSSLLQSSLPDLLRAYTEKAELMGRFQKAHGVSQNALREALAMESEMAALLLEAWRDAPDRQRLVAADNVVTQILAEAQRYYYTPADAYRKNLQTSVADLRSGASILPDTLKAAASRLERHIEDLLRAKPTEQVQFDRLRFHSAGPRAAMLVRELRREVDENSASRERYRVYLAAYFCALLVLSAYLAARLIRRELVSRRRGAEATATVADEVAPAEPTLAQPSGVKPEA